ncbi:PQ loop repeat protein [Exophiala viscosa]|uniref:PQ loop repeat protein n=1 Tax=Exophiala viscosa TaxID=2486360 RepID=A0AAN6DZ52_9EURO|nr:PQ loop repeat protein [Exophiala viscosa]
MDIPVAANVLGVLGAVCWSVQLIPQIIINYRRHDTTGLQPTMMLLWACAGIPLGVYNIVENFNIALRIQPQLLTTLSLITWVQCKYYGNKWPVSKCAATTLPVAAAMGGIECGLVFALRRAKHHHTEWPITFMAVLSACFLCAGVLRHYWDIYKERTVRGISFIFVGIDAMGDLTSLISVFFQPHLDILGMIIYGSELVLWLGVFACGGYFNFRPWLQQQARKHQGTITTTDASEGRDSRAVPEQLQRSFSRQSSSSSTVFQTASGEGRRQSEHGSIRLRTMRFDTGTEA